MNLLDRAESDNSFLLEDVVNGFARSASFQAPTVGAGQAPAAIVVGVQYIRRGFKINPSTGLSVASDEAAITARIASLTTLTAFDESKLPTDSWTVTVSDSTGTAITYKIEKGKRMIDRTAGRVTFAELKKVGTA